MFNLQRGHVPLQQVDLYAALVHLGLHPVPLFHTGSQAALQSLDVPIRVCSQLLVGRCQLPGLFGGVGGGSVRQHGSTVSQDLADAGRGGNAACLFNT